MKYAVFLLLAFSLTQAAFAEPEYVQAVARPGDGGDPPPGLYRPPAYFCRGELFFKIHQHHPQKRPSAHKAYFLPILLYTYNGKSIRSTIGITDLPQAERIQAYNERMLSASLREQDYRVSRELWVPYHEIACPEAKTERTAEKSAAALASPAVSTGLLDESKLPIRGIYDIFGKGYERVPLIDNRLKGKVYYIVSGHGGPDPGAIGEYGKYKLCEDEYAYDVALRLTRNLLAHGATAYLIVRDNNDGIRSGEFLPCDKDEVSWPDQEIPASQVERLRQRANTINELFLKNEQQGVKHQRMLEIHIDSDKKNERIDTYFYYRAGDPASQNLVEILRQTFREKYDEVRKGRGYSGTMSERDLHMIRETLPPIAFIELGNIKNRNDQNRLIMESNRKLLANWLTEGLIREATQ